MGSHDKTKETDMSAWTEKLLATYTLAEIQAQAKHFGIKNVKKFTKAELADKIEATITAAHADDKIEEKDMNENTETVEVTPIIGSPDELIALLNATTDEPEIVTDEVDIELESDAIAAGIMGEHEAKGTSIPVITADEVAGIVADLEASVEDSPTTETDTEAAPKLTDEYIAMLAEVKENAGKRKHPIWNALKDADDILLAQAVGKASTVRGMLWKLGKHIAPAIAAYDAAEAAQAAGATTAEASQAAKNAAEAAKAENDKMGE